MTIHLKPMLCYRRRTAKLNVSDLAERCSRVCLLVSPLRATVGVARPKPVQPKSTQRATSRSSQSARSLGTLARSLSLVRAP
eukprot:6181653-Pleurochrysis_carterae.AAC.2